MGMPSVRVEHSQQTEIQVPRLAGMQVAGFSKDRRDGTARAAVQDPEDPHQNIWKVVNFEAAVRSWIETGNGPCLQSN